MPNTHDPKLLARRRARYADGTEATVRFTGCVVEESPTNFLVSACATRATICGGDNAKQRTRKAAVACAREKPCCSNFLMTLLVSSTKLCIDCQSTMRRCVRKETAVGNLAATFFNERKEARYFGRNIVRGVRKAELAQQSL